MVPLVSIAVVTFNHALFIKDALESALSQDYSNIEIIVADDGSTDGTSEIVNDYSVRYKERITALPSKQNRGLVGIIANYNSALMACKGKYIAFLEGDDLFLPGKIKKQVEWFELNEDCVLCGHDVEVFDSITSRKMYLWSERFPLRFGTGADSVLRLNVPFCTVSIMVRASKLPAGGWDERLRIVCDWMMWINILSSGGRFGFVPGVLAKYRRHADNITSSHNQIRQDDQFATLALAESRYPLLRESCRRGRARLFYSLGVGELIRGDLSAARACFLQSISCSPCSQWKSWAGGLITLMPGKIASAMLARVNPSFRGTF